MKNLITILLLLLSTQPLFAQKEKKVPADHHYYPASKGSLGFGLMFTANEGAKNVDQDYSIPNQPNGNLTYLEGVKSIHLYGYVKKDSASFYRYTIAIDGKQVATDAMLSVPIGNEPFSMPQYDLGKFNVENKKIVITYYKIGDVGNVGRSIIYSKPISAARFNLVALSHKDPKVGGSFISGFEKANSPTIKTDKFTNALVFSIKNVDLDFIYTLYLIDKSNSQVVYQTNIWEYSFLTVRSVETPYVVINAKYFNKSGDYEIKVIPRLSSSFRDRSFHAKTLVYSFTIKNEDEKVFSNKEIAIIGLCILAIFGAILGTSLTYLKRKNKKKLALVQQQKELSKIQLNSIRSQLNPHFMFNALAGIQNLMNTHKIDEANRYLGKFARLTRNVLDGKELISLAEEKSLLEDYLQMEQLRFGFTYEIKTDNNLNLDNVEIPTMLLQPFVENAVKHGIAEMGAKGEIYVSFSMENQNLILNVKDNGNGFDTNKNYTGLGLQLSKNRISLLNTLYNETSFLLDTKSSESGSEITITLTQWL